MARLIFRTKDSPGPDPKLHHRGHGRGDCIDILRDNQFCGIEIVGKDLWRVVVVPSASVERFAYLLERQLDTGAHKKKWRIDMDALEAMGRRQKGAELDAIDEITVLDPAAIDALAMVKYRPRDGLVIG